MTSALREWQEHQRTQFDVQAVGLDRDIADIRNLLQGRYGAVARWRQSPNDEPPPPFEIVNPEIAVKLFNERQATRRSVYQPLSDAERVIFLNTEQQAVLRRIAARLGGAPDPEYGVVELVTFWQKFYSAAIEGGMYLHREFESSVIEELVFLDIARTKAAAKIRVRNSGTTFLLEKVEGVWTARASNTVWIA